METLVLSPPATRGSHKRPSAAILFLHGGPHAAVTNTFSPPLAFLAAAGYRVILPNYRGSSGYGERYLQALPGHVGEVCVLVAHPASAPQQALFGQDCLSGSKFAAVVLAVSRLCVFARALGDGSSVPVLRVDHNGCAVVTVTSNQKYRKTATYSVCITTPVPPVCLDGPELYTCLYASL